MSVSHSPKVRTRAKSATPNKRRRWFTKGRASRWLSKGAIIMVALWLGCSVVCKIARPIRLVDTEKREKAKVVSDYLALKKQNQDLQRQLHYLQTPDGVAQEARKQGFVKPGEVSLVIPEEDKTTGPGQ